MSYSEDSLRELYGPLMCPRAKRTCIHAARVGDVNLLEWARDNGCSWDASVCAEAAANNNLTTLKWLRDSARRARSPTGMVALGMSQQLLQRLSMVISSYSSGPMITGATLVIPCSHTLLSMITSKFLSG